MTKMEISPRPRMRGYKSNLRFGAVTGFVILLVATVLAVVTVTSLMSVSYAVAGVTAASVFLITGVATAWTMSGSVPPLSIIAVITYCHAILFIVRPLYAIAYADSVNIFTGAAYDQWFLLAEVFAGAGFLALCLAYGAAAGSVARDRDRPPVQPLASDRWDRFRPELVWITVIGMSLYFLYILQTGWAAYWRGTLTGRSDEQRVALSSSSGYLYSGLQFATGAVLFLFLQATVSKKRPAQVASLLVLGVTVFPQIASGSRAVFIPIVIAVLAILSRANPNIFKLSRVLVWLQSFILVGIVAPRIWRDNLASGVSIGDSIVQASRPEELFGGLLGGLDTAMVDAFAVQLSAHANGTLQYLYGSSYVNALTSVIPRALWPGKPGSLDEHLNAVLFPATDAKNIGFAFSAYSEPTANFGIVGVVVVFSIFGFLLGKLTKITNSSTSVIPTFFGVIVVGYIFPLMRGSFTFNSQRVLVPLVPVLIALLLEMAFRARVSSKRTHSEGSG